MDLPPVELNVPYTIEMRVVTNAQIPVLGSREVVTLSYSHVTFAEKDGAWTQTFVPCAMFSASQVSFPDTFIRSLPTRTHDVSWTDGVYHVDTGASFLGVSKPVAVLPTSPKDPLVTDADGDGHPGVTVFLTLPVFGKIRLYLAQANHSKLTGTAKDGEISGTVELLRVETRTLAASVGLFAVNPKVEVVEGASTFRIRKDPKRTCQGAFPTR